MVGGVGLWYKFSVVPRMEESFGNGQGRATRPVGVWMDHAWSEGDKTDDEVRRMFQTLRQSGVTDAYFHVGPLEGDGSLSPKKYEDSSRLLRLAREEMPQLRTWAWIGQVERSWGGPLDLSRESTREAIVRSGQQVVAAGYGGVHLNIEPVANESEDFLNLVQRLRNQLHERRGLLSVTTDDVEPFWGAKTLVQQCCGDVTFWSPAYLLRVLGYVDQAVVMTYDSKLRDPQLYSWYVSLVTRRLFPLLPEERELLVGIPSYETGNRHFDPTAENIVSGLMGVLDGLGFVESQTKADRFGIALYAYWETSREEWRILRDHWQANQR